MKRPIQTAVVLVSIMGKFVHAGRPSDVVDLVDAWNGRLAPADCDGKHCGMLDSPYAFYRGTDHLFWRDFTDKASPFGNVILESEFGDGDRTETWIQGDLHAHNFGSFDNDEGDIVYALNDFDEAYIADYQFDVIRLATSLILIVRQNTKDPDVDVTFAEEETNEILDAFSEEYLNAIASFRGNDGEVKREFRKSNTKLPLSGFLDEVESDKSRAKMLKKWTNRGRIQNDRSFYKIGEASPAEKEAIIGTMESYGTTLSGSLEYSSSYFSVKDVAKRLYAGTGSFGTPRYYVLVEGESDDGADDRILDVMLQQDPTPHLFAPNPIYSYFLHAADAHAEGYKALTTNTDDHLGWMELCGGVPEGVHSVRERLPYKEAFPTDELDGDKSFV